MKHLGEVSVVTGKARGPPARPHTLESYLNSERLFVPFLTGRFRGGGAGRGRTNTLSSCLRRVCLVWGLVPRPLMSVSDCSVSLYNTPLCTAEAWAATCDPAPRSLEGRATGAWGQSQPAEGQRLAEAGGRTFTPSTHPLLWVQEPPLPARSKLAEEQPRGPPSPKPRPAWGQSRHYVPKPPARTEGALGVP